MRLQQQKLGVLQLNPSGMFAANWFRGWGFRVWGWVLGLGLYRGNGRVILGLYWDNGKENGQPLFRI